MSGEGERGGEPRRDEALGRALRELPAPPHGEGFETRLRALLEDEAASRVPARRRRRVPVARVPRLGLALGGAGGVAAAVLVVLALLPSGRNAPLGPQPAVAAEVVARAQRALAAARSLSAVLVVRSRIEAGGPVTTTRVPVTMTDRGDLRVLGGAQDGDFFYNSRSGREVQLHLPGTTTSFVTTGVAPGEPDGFIGDRRLGLQAAEVARALAAARDGAVTATRQDGRAVWILRARIPINKLGFSGDRLTVVVDRASGFPLAVRETLRGRLVRGFALQRLRLNTTLRAAAFAPRVPAGATVVDEGFRSAATLAAAARSAGYAPLVPARLPSGYRRAETRVAATTPSPTGDEGLNPPSRDVISTAYRHGLDRVTVSTRRTGSVGAAAWADPVAVGEGVTVRRDRVRITSGALRGAVANVVVDPQAVPHIWVATARLVVTIAGPLSRAELLAAVSSLQAGP